MDNELEKHRATRRAYKAEDLPPDLVEALASADYSHLPCKGARK